MNKKGVSVQITPANIKLYLKMFISQTLYNWFHILQGECLLNQKSSSERCAFVLTCDMHWTFSNTHVKTLAILWTISIIIDISGVLWEYIITMCSIFVALFTISHLRHSPVERIPNGRSTSRYYLGGGSFSVFVWHYQGNNLVVCVILIWVYLVRG